MVPWKAEKPKLAAAAEPLPSDASDSEKGDDIRRVWHKPRLLNWHTYLLALALV
jgi:hypothetical protein